MRKKDYRDLKHYPLSQGDEKDWRRRDLKRDRQAAKRLLRQGVENLDRQYRNSRVHVFTPAVSTSALQRMLFGRRDRSLNGLEAAIRRRLTDRNALSDMLSRLKAILYYSDGIVISNDWGRVLEYVQNNETETDVPRHAYARCWTAVADGLDRQLVHAAPRKRRKAKRRETIRGLECGYIRGEYYVQEKDGTWMRYTKLVDARLAATATEVYRRRRYLGSDYIGNMSDFDAPPPVVHTPGGYAYSGLPEHRSEVGRREGKQLEMRLHNSYNCSWKSSKATKCYCRQVLVEAR